MAKSNHDDETNLGEDVRERPEDEQTEAADPTVADAGDATEQVTDDLQERVDDLTASLQRVQAEFMNFRRRAEAERLEATTFAKTRVMRDFLAVRDSFDAELAHRPSDVDATWAASIDSIRGQFDKAMKAQGVERFESVGHAFDPHRHEAVVMDDSEGAHEVVVEELQAGYALGDAVLRHAMVKVGRSDKVAEA